MTGLLDIARQKFEQKTANGASRWQAGFASAEAAQNYVEGVSRVVGMDISGSTPAQNYRAAQANAGLYAQKWQQKMQGAGQKWMRNYRAAFSR